MWRWVQDTEELRSQRSLRRLGRGLSGGGHLAPVTVREEPFSRQPLPPPPHPRSRGVRAQGLRNCCVMPPGGPRRHPLRSTPNEVDRKGIGGVVLLPGLQPLPRADPPGAQGQGWVALSSWGGRAAPPGRTGLHEFGVRRAQPHPPPGRAPPSSLSSPPHPIPSLFSHRRLSTHPIPYGFFFF